MWDVPGYIAHALRSLMPTWHPVANPIQLLGTLNRKQWIFFMASSFRYRYVGGCR